MDWILDATCLQDCQRSISKLRDGVDLVCPQTLCVFCIDWVDRTEVLLKIILGLKNHPVTTARLENTYLVQHLHVLVSTSSF